MTTKQPKGEVGGVTLGLTGCGWSEGNAAERRKYRYF